MKKIFLYITLLFLFGCNKLNSISDVNFNKETRPNVLIISIDDLKDWVGFLNGYEGKVHTPNIDKLASQGVAFTNAHTAASVCCPSRNSFMLGKRGATTGLYNNNQWWKAVYPNEVPLPQYFKQNGYYVAGAGKIFITLQVIILHVAGMNIRLRFSMTDGIFLVGALKGIF